MTHGSGAYYVGLICKIGLKRSDLPCKINQARHLISISICVSCISRPPYLSPMRPILDRLSSRVIEKINGGAARKLKLIQIFKEAV